MGWRSTKEDEVWIACDQLYAENTSATIEAIRARLKLLTNKGGNTKYISRYKKTWELAHPEAAKKMKASEKQKTPDIAMTAAEALRRTLETGVREEIKQELQAANEKIQLLTDEQATLEEELAELKKYCETVEKEKSEAEVKAIAATQSAEISEKNMIAANAQIELQKEFMERREAEWNRERNQVHLDHENQLNRLSTEITEQRDRHHQAIQMFMDNQEAYRQQSIVEKDELKVEAQKLQKALAASKEQESAFKIELQNQKNSYANLEEQYKKQVQSCIDLQEEIYQHKEKVAVLCSEVERQREAEITMKRDYQQHINTLQDSIKKLHQQLADLVSKLTNGIINNGRQ